MNSIKLLTHSITRVPLCNYECNFTFIVNKKRFETNKFIADLISPTISKKHHIDPTFNEFVIDTHSKGNFENVLNLITFEEKEIKEENEIDFISEIFDQIGAENVSIYKEIKEINISNAISKIQQHQNLQNFSSQNYTNEIEYIVEHFYDMTDNEEEQFVTLPLNVIEQIVSNKNLQLQTEDQLLRIINHLYQQDHQYSKLYDYVYFSNVGKTTLEEFFTIFDIDDLDISTWISLSRRLTSEKSINTKTTRYHRKNQNSQFTRNRQILYTDQNLDGIFSYFTKHSKIDDEVSISFSSRVTGDPKQLLQIESKTNDFYTKCEENQWICFEFTKSRIVPLNYSIRSVNDSPGKMHPRSWVIEGSTDKKKWTKIDEQSDCNFLNGRNLVHTFSIQKKNEDEDSEFKFIRMRQIGPNWYNNDHLNICSFEFYGILI